MNLIRVIIVLVLGGFFLLSMRINLILLRVTSENDFELTKTNRWNRVDTGDTTVSADGSSYYMYSNKGTENNLIIYFSGGGLAWDSKTAFQPMELKNLFKSDSLGYYFDRISPYNLVSAKGIMNKKNEANPFRNWNVAYIPYSTGDLHVGNTEAEFDQDGDTKRLRFNGRKNVLASLDWIDSSLGKPDKLLICGESAGAFGSLFWLPEIARRFSDSEISYLCDAAYLESDSFPSIIDDLWGADFESFFGYTPGPDPVVAAFRYAAEKLPNVAMMHSNTVWDDILPTYSAMLNKTGADKEEAVNDWSREMLSAVKELSGSINNYYYYLTDYGLDPKKGTTPHTMSRAKLFFEAEEGGVAYLNWISDIVLNGKTYSVGSDFLAGSE